MKFHWLVTGGENTTCFLNDNIFLYCIFYCWPWARTNGREKRNLFCSGAGCARFLSLREGICYFFGVNRLFLATLGGAAFF